MTIISLIIAFALCYFIRDLGKLHRFEWLKSATSQCNEKCKDIPGWSGVTGFLFYFGVPLLIIGLLNLILFESLGTLGSVLLAIAVLIYTFGPHDLDTDIDSIIHADDDEAQREALNALLGDDANADEDSCQSNAVEYVFRESLQRWFGTIFWFVLLGIYGALMYRLADRLTEGDLKLEEEQHQLFLRLRQIMDWPVAQLMTLALAIATDFDSVYRSWKKYHNEQGNGLFEGDNGFLLASAKEIVTTGHAARDGYADQLSGPLACLKQAMDLIWRILGVWAFALAILLLIDVIA
jgi:AmpE protein